MAGLAEFTQIVKLCFAWDPGSFQSLSACPQPVSSAGLSLESDSSNESSWVSVWGSPASVRLSGVLSALAKKCTENWFQLPLEGVSKFLRHNIFVTAVC